jgi:DNA-binding GntR family transcriptional regulator
MRLVRAAAELRAVVDAVQAGDAEAAAKACALHVQNAGRTALAKLSSSERSGEERP